MEISPVADAQDWAASMQFHMGEGHALDVARGQPQDLSWLITDFTERVPDVAHAVVVSSDGVALAASDGIWPDRLEHLSAVTSGLTSLAQGAARMFDGGDLTQTLVSMERGVLVIMAISDGSSLAVLAAAEADLDLVAYEMTILTEQAGSVLTPDLRRPANAAEERS
jgi:predicted regulator of Ras-like GTPase activity (Roadblock/LC7/MglB family)